MLGYPSVPTVNCVERYASVWPLSIIELRTMYSAMESEVSVMSKLGVLFIESRYDWIASSEGANTV